MNPEIKAKWIAALKSGEYEQGRGGLALQAVCGDVRYCCLGVLCDLAAKEGVVNAEWSGREGWYGGNASYLPSSVALWAGIEDGLRSDAHNPRIPSLGVSLAELNDGVVTFDRIAEIIEEHL